MALSGSVAVRATSQNNLIFSWAAAQNISANCSVISWQLLLEAKQFGKIVASPGSGWSVTVAGREFSGTTSLAIENNQTKVLASGQATLEHQADGSGSFSFTFSQQFYITFGGESISVVSGSGSAQLDTIPRSSRPVAGDGVLGSPMTISLEGIGASTHTLEYSFGKASGVIARDVTDSCRWTPPLSLASQIPDTVSGTAIIKCTTYAGGVPVGSAQTAVKLTVPESVVPSLSASWEDPSGALETLGCLVQNVSRLAVAVSGTGIYGSGITGVQVTLDGKSYGGGCLTNSGERSLQAAVTDSRGRTAAKTYPITVVPYQTPWLTLSASRCLEDGTADDTGDYAKITVTGHVTELGGANSALLTLKWGLQQEQIPLSAGDIAYGVTVYADPNATMEISAVLSDRLVAASRQMILSTGYATLDLLAGGKGIAFGKAATREGFECAMPAYFSGGLYGIGADGTVDSRSLFDRVAALENAAKA